MRILTFNWHEAYVSTLARTGHTFDVVERDKGGSRAWFYETRPVPPNVRIVREATARDRVRAGGYDVVICHNVPDLIWLRDDRVPRVVVLHNRLTTELALGGNTVPRRQHLADVARVMAEARGPVQVVCISETKKADWGFEDAAVIPPGIDLRDYDGYVGDVRRILRVGNFMKARDVMLGYADQLAIVGGRPSTLLGLNEPEPGAEVRFTRSWDDLKAAFRGHRVFLNTTVDGFEDGYNLAMLEAMATGMPVVSTPNETSPLTDGVDGFVSADRVRLAACVGELLADHDLARRLGAAARATVARTFPMDAFVARWNRVLETAAARAGERPMISLAGPAGPRPGVPAPRRRVLLSYVSYPATTARYFEDALRRSHEVVTVGPAMTPALREAWNLQNMKEAIHPHDIHTGNETDLLPIVEKLSRTWTPDLFLWVESVYGHFPRGIRELGVPTACYLIDSHMNLSWHLEWARQFDHVFLAQREYIPQFQAAGVARVSWLPLGCDPAVHGPVPGPKRHDVGFVGSLTPHHQRRQVLIGRLRERFDVHVERAFLREMAAVFSASRIVFNDAVRRDLNMRVFEALCSGSFLLTDRAEPSGLDELFIDREHLAIYEDDTIEDLVAYYLAHEDEREAIAARGRAEVMAHHTYDHRVAHLLRSVLEPRTPASLRAADRRFVNDPLILEAGALMGAGKPEEALARLAWIDGQRELSSWERFTAAQLAADAHGACGRLDRARAGHAAALAELSPAEQDSIRGASL
ncbi:MAG: glycosyltransferase [Vicinamibacterales bacterium]